MKIRKNDPDCDAEFGPGDGMSGCG
jgi:hypothetical protein